MAFLGDEDTTHDDGAGADDTDTGADDESTADDEEDTSQNNDSEDDDDESSDDGDDGDGKGDSKESTDTSKDKDTEEDEDDGEEPETRRPKTNAEWAAWRKSQKDKKSKDQQKGGGDEGDEGDSDEDDADDLSPEDRKAIDKRIGQAIKPFVEKAIESEVEGEIAKFLNANPDFKPFEAKARRFALHPSRQNIPIKSIFYEVAGDKLLKIGADRVRKADKDARKTKTGGSATNEKGSTSYKDMPLSDFEKELEREKTKVR